jgi:cell division septation protein DedD
MEASLKHRIVGSILVITIALVISPLFLKEKKPAWLVREDEKSLTMPIAPAPIKVTSISPKAEWKLPAEAIQIITDNQPAKKIKVAEVAFVKQQHILGAKTKQAIIEEQVAKFAQAKVNSRNKGKKTVYLEKKLSTSSSSFYSLQLATFSNKIWAQRLLERLKKQGIEGYLSKRTSKNGTVFTMVMTGKINDLNEIKRLQTKLDTAIHVKSLIIKLS